MKYVTGVTGLFKFIVLGLFPEGGEIALDMTMGNGHDTVFLASLFNKVYAIEIQKEAVEAFNAPKNVTVFNMDHSLIEHMDFKPQLIVYNLGYLPGSDKSITTTPETTLKSLEIALEKLQSSGFIIMSLYYGHDEGKEATKILEFVKELPNEFGVMHHEFINRKNNPPSLIVIEKR